MKFKILPILAVVLICAALSLVSCKSATIGTGPDPKIGHGPPPHAPAHGHRRKHQGLELVYDSGRGVYVVIGFPSHYYFKGSYYRLRGTQWEISTSIKSGWYAISEQSLPPGLRAKQEDKSKTKERPGRGRGVQKKK